MRHGPGNRVPRPRRATRSRAWRPRRGPGRILAGKPSSGWQLLVALRLSAGAAGGCAIEPPTDRHRHAVKPPTVRFERPGEPPADGDEYAIECATVPRLISLYVPIRPL